MEATVQFHPIDLDSLVSNLSLEFNLYLRTLENRYILFRERSLEFSDRHRSRLLENKIQTLYVSGADQRSYGRYVEQNIGSIVKDPAVPSEKKAEFIYSVSKGVLLDAFEDPRAGDIVHRTEELTSHTVNYILKGNDSVQNLISIMSKDYYTFTHSINVCVFTVALASKVGVENSQELNDLATGALLHDVGKSEIPLDILNKTGPLDPEEMNLMRQHVVFGEQILSENPKMNRTRMLPVSLHHEKMNGQGYPRGLRGEQVHLYGRIAAIADCFDAMTTTRSYQAARHAFEALQIMKTQVKDHFDQEVLSAFIRLLQKVN